MEAKELKCHFSYMCLSDPLSPLCPISNVTKAPWLKEGPYGMAIPSWVDRLRSAAS